MSYFQILMRSMFRANPVLIMALGLCSTLAVTVSLENAVFMSLIVTWTTIVSSLTVAVLRYRIPHRYRLICYMLIISTTVIAAELFLAGFYPDIASALGPYTGLVVTNCLVMGKLESYSKANSTVESLFDSLGTSMGYTVVLIIMSVLRELPGNGTLWGLQVLSEGYVPNRLFISAPGAFIVFAFLIFIINATASTLKREK